MTAKIKTVKSTHTRHKPTGISDHAFAKVYWPYLPLVLIMVFLLGLSVQSGALSAVLAHHSSKVLSYATSMSNSLLLKDTNDDRSANKVAPLALNSELSRAAQSKANDMAARNYWSHDTPDGNPPWVFVTDQGYSYQKLGENLATGFSNEMATVNAWMASPSHRENLLDPAFTEVGFGFANNSNYTSAGGGPMTIVVAYYGRPQAAAPLVANLDSGNTNIQVANTSSSVLASESAPTSHAQIALARLPFAAMATNIVLIGMGAVIGIWLSRHLLMIRRAWAKSESWAITHPLFDIGLLITAALLFLLHQTAGFIR